jgi:hypothetical protein
MSGYIYYLQTHDGVVLILTGAFVEKIWGRSGLGSADAKPIPWFY